MISDVAENLPLPTLLSQSLVAFTIEFDNEAEHRLPHRTSLGPKPGDWDSGPWLVSQVLWSNVMRYVSDEGIRIADLHESARTKRDLLSGLQRWGYVIVGPAATESRNNSPHGELVVRPTAAGRRAKQIWEPLGSVIDKRWRERFGPGTIDALRSSLLRIVDQLEVDLPDYLPIVHPTHNGRAEIPPPPRSERPRVDASDFDLSALLSKVLLAFTLDFEQESRISLAISANTLRVLGQTGVPVRELPRLTGVSKEAIAMATGFLERHGCSVSEPNPAASRGKVVRLTEKGARAREKYFRVLASTESRWREHFGESGVNDLIESIRPLAVAEPGSDHPRLFECIEPYPEGWRASVRRPDTLPHYPMVLHRGGFPDGS